MRRDVALFYVKMVYEDLWIPSLASIAYNVWIL